MRNITPSLVPGGTGHRLEAAAGSSGNEAGTLAAGETILVVEDDDRVRALVQRILGREGYRMLEARDGREALAVVESHEGFIHLILSDVIVPDLNGVEIVRRVQERSSRTKALFMSGHTDQALQHDGLLLSGADFLQKPFAPHALVSKVREVLDA
jgi:DNA-binding response OmpR family regulator